MPKGENVAKGTRPAGRSKGTRNKTTVEQLERERIAQQAQDEVNKAKIAKIKLAKDVLEDYVGAFHNIAAVYQNRVAAAYARGVEPNPKDLDAFEKWGTLTAQTAKNLAEFQSPKFKAIAISSPPPSVNPANDIIDLQATDPIAQMKAYQKLIRSRATA